MEETGPSISGGGIGKLERDVTGQELAGAHEGLYQSNQTDAPKYQGADMSQDVVFLAFLNLSYSLCKQYISWYEREVKRK